MLFGKISLFSKYLTSPTKHLVSPASGSNNAIVKNATQPVSIAVHALSNSSARVSSDFRRNSISSAAKPKEKSNLAPDGFKNREFKSNNIEDQMTEKKGAQQESSAKITRVADVYKERVIVPTSSGNIVTAVYTPPRGDKKGPFPVLFYVLNTAYTVTETNLIEVFCNNLCAKTKCKVIIIYHRLVPEYNIAEAAQDVYDVIKYLLEHPDAKRIFDLNRVTIASYRSGGTLTALATRDLINKTGVKIAAQILLSPTVDNSMGLNSPKKFEEKDTDISDDFIRWFLNLANPKDRNENAPSISPLFSKDSKLKNLPPTTIVVAEHDRCSSDREEDTRKLESLGINITRLPVPKQIYAYWWRNIDFMTKVVDEVLGVIFKNASSSIDDRIQKDDGPSNVYKR